MSDDMYASPDEVIDYWRDKAHYLERQLKEAKLVSDGVQGMIEQVEGYNLNLQKSNKELRQQLQAAKQEANDEHDSAEKMRDMLDAKDRQIAQLRQDFLKRGDDILAQCNEIDTLRAEVERLKGYESFAYEKINELESRVQELEKALAEYAVHKDDCVVNLDDESDQVLTDYQTCTCGLKRALDGKQLSHNQMMESNDDE